MKETIVKIVLVLFIFLLMDVAKPLGYLICIEFLLLGVIFISLHFPLQVAVTLNLVSGYFNDCLVSTTLPLYVIEFMVLTFIVHYSQLCLKKKKAQFIIIIGALLLHVLFQAALSGGISAGQYALYIFHSFIGYKILDYFLKKWLNRSYVEFI